jgi:hypothetical protein
MMGNAAGLDMMTQETLNQFMLAYSASIAEDGYGEEPPEHCDLRGWPDSPSTPRRNPPVCRPLNVNHERNFVARSLTNPSNVDKSIGTPFSMASFWRDGLFLSDAPRSTRRGNSVGEGVKRRRSVVVPSRRVYRCQL